MSNVASFDSHKDQSAENIIRSVVMYIEFYSDTANKKPVRITAIGNAQKLLEFFVMNMAIHGDVAYDLIRVALQKILLKTKKAEMSPEIESFRDELGFLKVLLSV